MKELKNEKQEDTILKTISHSQGLSYAKSYFIN